MYQIRASSSPILGEGYRDDYENLLDKPNVPVDSTIRAFSDYALEQTRTICDDPVDS